MPPGVGLWLIALAFLAVRSQKPLVFPTPNYHSLQHACAPRQVPAFQLAEQTIVYNYVFSYQMQHKLRAIVLRSTPYSDSSVIVRMFTDELGMQSYLVNGVRKKKAVITPAMLQALTLLEIEAYHKENSGLQRLKELHVYPLLEQLQLSPLHHLAATVVAECFGRAVREEAANEALFRWMQRQIVGLDASDDPGVEGLALLSRLTEWLGFKPQNDAYQPDAWLNLSEGIFERTRDLHSNYASPQTTRQLGYFLQKDRFAEQDLPGKRYLDDLMRLYQIHSPGFSLPRSLDLFRELVLSRQ